MTIDPDRLRGDCRSNPRTPDTTARENDTARRKTMTLRCAVPGLPVRERGGPAR